MADGELAAVFKGLAKDAAEAAGKITESVAKLSEQTADIEESNVAKLLDLDAKSADDIASVGKKEFGSSSAGAGTADITRDASRDIDGYASPRDLERTHEIGGNSSSKNVAKIRDSMAADGWQGEPVSVLEHDGKKYLLDGHHRRAAAIRAGLDQVPYKLVNLPFKGYQTLDDVLGFVRPDNLRYKGRPF